MFGAVGLELLPLLTSPQVDGWDVLAIGVGFSVGVVVMLLAGRLLPHVRRLSARQAVLQMHVGVTRVEDSYLTLLLEFAYKRHEMIIKKRTRRSLSVCRLVTD